MRLQGALISTRCLVTIGHFVALVLLFTTIGNNIVVTIAREGGNESLALSQTTAALIVGVFCFSVDVISGIVMGHSLFHPMTNMIQIFFHFIGGVFLSFIITQYWGYYALWPVVITCNFPPLLSEIYMLVKLYVIRTAPFNSSSPYSLQ